MSSKDLLSGKSGKDKKDVKPQAAVEKKEDIKQEDVETKTDIEEKPSDDLLEGGQSAETQEQKPEENPAQEIDPNAVKNELMNRGKMRIPKAQFSVKDVLRQRRENGKKVVMTPKQEIEFRKKGLSPKQELKRRRNISK